MAFDSYISSYINNKVEVMYTQTIKVFTRKFVYHQWYFLKVLCIHRFYILDGKSVLVFGFVGFLVPYLLYVRLTLEIGPVCGSAAPISGPFSALVDDGITFNASIIKAKIRDAEKG